VKWQKQGYIKRITKGRYLLASQPVNEITLYRCANQIYQPSYISTESALRYYDLIPEGVYLTTACTTKKTQTLSGEVGEFRYMHLKPSLFRGYMLITIPQTKLTFALASVEKAVCDFFYLKPHVKETDFTGLRIDSDCLRSLTTPERLQACANAFKVQRLAKIISLFISFTQS